MNLQEFFVKFENDSFGSVKEMTAEFNGLKVDDYIF